MDPMYSYNQPENSYNNMYGQQQGYSGAHGQNFQSSQPYYDQSAAGFQKPNNFAYNDNLYQNQPPYEEKKKSTSDSMPHPLAVNYKDYEKYYGQTFDTSTHAQPPLISTSNVYFTGYRNCSPNFMRSTLYACPNSAEILKKSYLPLGLVICPFSKKDNFEIPIVDHGSDGPVRCRRCRSYINPNVVFINGGKNFKCNLCACVNEVPESYFCNVDQTGTRLDYEQRPELMYGTYDLTTNTNYCRHSSLKTSPTLLFMIDVSYSSVSSGMVKQTTQALANLIKNGFFDNYSMENGLKLGFLGYDTQIYAFLPRENSPPEMEIIFDLDEPFIPSLSTFLTAPVQNKNAIVNLLHRIPEIFANNKQVDVVLGPVLVAAGEIIQSYNGCGKLVVFHGNLPTFETQGRLSNAEDRAQLGSEDEKKILAPQNSYYSNLASKFVENGVGIDLFLFPSGPVEIASLSPLCSLTGGNLKLFKYFKSNAQGSHLCFEIEESLKSYSGFDTMSKLRCSAGMSIKSNFGNFTIVNESEILMSAVDSNSTIFVELVHDDKLTDLVHFQFAILYTSLSGMRLIRIHNLTIKVVDSILEVFKNADNEAISLYFLRLSCKNVLENSVSITKQTIISMLVKILASYRQNCATSSSPMQLVLPENIKLLPLYLNTILNSDCVNGGKELMPDDKSYSIFCANAASLFETNVMLYPRVFDVLSTIERPRDLNYNFEGYSCEFFIPNGIVQVRSSSERLHHDRVYLLENGNNIYIWFGKLVSPNIFNDLFGPGFNEQYFGVVMDHMPGIDSQLSKQLSSLIAQIRKSRERYMRVSFLIIDSYLSTGS